MRYDFHDRFTNKVIHTENIPDDCSRPVRIALEQAVIRGRPADKLRQFRSMIANKAKYASEIEAQFLRHLITAIDGELAKPSARANLARANLESAYLESANLESAYLASARNLPAGFVAVDPPEPYELVAAASLAEHAQRYREHHPEVPVCQSDMRSFPPPVVTDVKILASSPSTTGQGRVRTGARGRSRTRRRHDLHGEHRTRSMVPRHRRTGACRYRALGERRAGGGR